MSEVKYSETQFNKASEIIRTLPKDGPVKPSTDDQLFFYAYFKQGTIGDVNIDKPGFLDFTGRAKWDAWKSVEGTTKEEAWTRYVAKFVEILIATGDNESKKYRAEIDAA